MISGSPTSAKASTRRSTSRPRPAKRNAAKGANFGWNLFEGTHEYEGGSTAGLTMPVFEYTHSDGCSVTGGYRYRGAAVPGLQGAYLFADYCNNTIRVLSFDGTIATEIRSQRGGAVADRLVR